MEKSTLERRAEWEEWVKKNHYLMPHPVDFEARFALEVLYLVPLISTDNITPQYEFIDSAGRSRQIDFVIRDSSRGLGLAIELDGLSKLSDYGKFDDLLARQNDLLSKTRDEIFMLFRYANKRWLENPKAVAEQITSELKAEQIAYRELVSRNRLAQEVEDRLKSAEKERDRLRRELETERQLNQDNTESSHSFNLIREDLSKKDLECEQLQTNHEQSRQDLKSFQSRVDQERQVTLEQNVKIVQHDRDILILKRLVGTLIACLIVAIVGVVSYLSLWSTRESPVYAQPAAPYAAPSAPTGEERAGSGRVYSAPSSPSESTPYAASPRSREIPSIASSEAGKYIGKTVMLCGRVMTVKKLNKCTMINIGRDYPYEEIALLIWNDAKSGFETQFGDLESLVGHTVSATGTVRFFREHLQMKLKNASLLTLMD